MTQARFRKVAQAGAILTAVAGFTLAATPATASTTAAASNVGAAQCGGNVQAVVGVYNYAYGDCSILGSPGHKVSVRWSAYGGSSNFAAFEVRGYRNGKAYWQGCGTSSGTCVVDWGNVGARLQVRAHSTYGTSTIYFYY